MLFASDSVKSLNSYTDTFQLAAEDAEATTVTHLAVGQGHSNGRMRPGTSIAAVVLFSVASAADSVRHVLDFAVLHRYCRPFTARRSPAAAAEEEVVHPPRSGSMAHWALSLAIGGCLSRVFTLTRAGEGGCCGTVLGLLGARGRSWFRQKLSILPQLLLLKMLLLLPLPQLVQQELACVAVEEGVADLAVLGDPDHLHQALLP